MRNLLAGAAIVLLCLAAPAFAHPHVWVAARDAGSVRAGRENRRLPSASGPLTRCIRPSPRRGWARTASRRRSDELAPLAKTNVEIAGGIPVFHRRQDRPQNYEFGEPKDYELVADDKKLVTLSFTLPLKEPVSAKKPFTFMVYDPTYFVDFELEKVDPITMKDAPAGCSLTTLRPDPLDGSRFEKAQRKFLLWPVAGRRFRHQAGDALYCGLSMKNLLQRLGTACAASRDSAAPRPPRNLREAIRFRSASTRVRSARSAASGCGCCRNRRGSTRPCGRRWRRVARQSGGGSFAGGGLLRLWRLSRRGAGPRQGGDRQLHARQ